MILVEAFSGKGNRFARKRNKAENVWIMNKRKANSIQYRLRSIIDSKSKDLDQKIYQPGMF